MSQEKVVYFGNEMAVSIATSFLQNYHDKNAKKALLLNGRPGVGKTHLTKYLAQTHNMNITIFNASASRKQKDIKHIITHAQMEDPSIIVLDECEGMKPSDISLIIKHSKHPVILCCNFIDAIDRSIKDMAITVKVESPPWWVYKQYVEYLLGDEYYSKEQDVLTDIAKKAKSFRHAERLLDDPDDEGTDSILDEVEQVRESLKGNFSGKFEMKPEELIHWVNDNSDCPDIISRADIYLKRTHKDSYVFWKYAYGLLGQVRSNLKFSYPRSFITMGRVKKAVSEKKTQDLVPEVTLTIDEDTLEQLLMDIEHEDGKKPGIDKKVVAQPAEISGAGKDMQVKIDDWL